MDNLRTWAQRQIDERPWEKKPTRVCSIDLAVPELPASAIWNSSSKISFVQKTKAFEPHPLRVWNKRDPMYPKAAVYVGRPTPWGNPFSHLAAAGTFPVDSREKAIACYILWLEAQPDLIALVRKHLRGKHLVCWCTPARCHAETLMAVANSVGKFVCNHPYLIGGGETGDCASCGENVPF